MIPSASFQLKLFCQGCQQSVVLTEAHVAVGHPWRTESNTRLHVGGYEQPIAVNMLWKYFRQDSDISCGGGPAVNANGDSAILWYALFTLSMLALIKGIVPGLFHVAPTCALELDVGEQSIAPTLAEAVSAIHLSWPSFAICTRDPVLEAGPHCRWSSQHRGRSWQKSKK